MKALEFENRVVKIYSNQEKSYAIVEWLKPVVYSEYEVVMHTVVALMQEKKFKSIIGDLRLLGALEAESIKLTNEILVPMLETLHKSAIVVPVEVFDKMINDDMMEKVNMENVQPKHQSFNTLEEAEAWVNQ